MRKTKREREMRVIDARRSVDVQSGSERTVEPVAQHLSEWSLSPVCGLVRLSGRVCLRQLIVKPRFIRFDRRRCPRVAFEVDSHPGVDESAKDV